MSWNYRVVKHIAPRSPDVLDAGPDSPWVDHATNVPMSQIIADDYWRIEEVYYDDDGRPKMLGDAEPHSVEGVDGLADDLAAMTRALGRPVLIFNDSARHGEHFVDSQPTSEEGTPRPDRPPRRTSRPTTDPRMID